VWRAGLIAGAAAGLLAGGAGRAAAGPVVSVHGGGTITAHITGEMPGYDCQIAAHDINGPRRVVNANGAVDLDSGPVPDGRHVVGVICENRKRGDATTHVVGRGTEVTTG
jgi:hypothetical protein